MSDDPCKTLVYHPSHYRFSSPIACVGGLSQSLTLTKIFILSSPAGLLALRRYSPLSFLFTRFTTRVWLLKPLPDRIHVICGVGSPVALQFNSSLSPALREIFVFKDLAIFGGSTDKKCAITIIKALSLYTTDVTFLFDFWISLNWLLKSTFFRI